MKTATAEQIATIRARAVNDTARAMMLRGVRLTYAQADDLGEEALDWLRSRLGLRSSTTDGWILCEPADSDVEVDARQALLGSSRA